MFADCAAAIARKEGLARAEAEARAYEIVLVEWLNANPPPSSGAERCAYCRASLGELGRDGVPVLTPADCEVWLHHGCWSDWAAWRRRGGGCPGPTWDPAAGLFVVNRQI